ncbi:C4-dicarboxylate TRAP transporter substrate-binding protein [Pelagimonas varians]|uniref:2,3-diketo-L-gulonate-binding periplasmic protein YiaO n=1 Tax=Pelagimonas varians TaxID=696760 RepID=A0A238L3K1_9RHOB|nr:C4-dicarboxylate TRAP transporter substrate-binding protein [Pelagimonas varians]PYG26494.1 TRAP-type C4-dicarboxylate transport system substrate-binding protein [Pelagimonas varians]SMX49654.1 2,3-diketo-L-gulonate-binding periplasmic protein YiaO precursor [Pelagimonas varians]
MKRWQTAAVAAIAALCAGATSAETVLIHGEAGPNRGARAKAIQWFADEVADRSGGDMRIDVQWGGALFKANAALQSIHDGVGDMGTIISVYYPQEFASYGIADLPLDNPDAWVGMRATDELFRTNAAVKQVLDQKNLVYIGTFTTSQVNIGCKGTAIRTADDIDGLKVRGVGAYGKVFGEMGANMVRMSIYDAYQGLDSGLIDCSQGYSYAVSALKQAEVMDSYTLLNWGQVGGVGTFMNKDAFDALSAEQQDLLLAAGSDMVDYFGQILTGANAKAIEDMKAGGLEVIELPDAERAKLLEKGAGHVDAWVETAGKAGLDGAALLDEYRGLLAKYAAERDAKGYPWAR